MMSSCPNGRTNTSEGAKVDHTRAHDATKGGCTLDGSIEQRQRVCKKCGHVHDMKKK